MSRQAVIKGTYIESEESLPRNFFFADLPNFRDAGGWKTTDGRTVRRGMIYRSACLNAKYHWYRFPHANTFLSEETRSYLVDRLGIRTDLDLRKESNCRGMNGSPLGEGVRFVNISSKGYASALVGEGREAFRRVFAELVKAENYPILVHCVSGQDRAGTVVFLANGLLGVPLEDLIRDWEMSRLWNGNPEFTYERRLAPLVKAIGAYEGETLSQKIESFVRSLGFSKEDVNRFREMMLLKQ